MAIIVCGLCSVLNVDFLLFLSINNIFGSFHSKWIKQDQEVRH